MKTYANLTNWMMHIDVDEYLQLSPLYRREDQPYRLQSDSKAQDQDLAHADAVDEHGGGQRAIQYPLHEVLWHRDLNRARCIPISRSGRQNVGTLTLGEYDSLLDTDFHRYTRRRTGWGKVIIRSGTDGPLGRFDGAHRCSVYNVPAEHPAVVDATPHPFRNPQGFEQDDGAEAGVWDPLSIADFAQRSLDDCLDKLKHIVNKENWRWKAGGARWCYQQFLPSGEQIRTGFFEGHEYEADIMMLEPVNFVVEDQSLRQSWYAQAAIAMMREFREGRTLPVGDVQAHSDRIVHMYVD